MKPGLLLLAVIFIGASSLTANAQLLNFDFTVVAGGSDSGTVTGEIIGLENNGTSTPSEVIVDSITSTGEGGPFSGPPGHGGDPDAVALLAETMPALPLTFTSSEFSILGEGQYYGGTDQFTVNSGQIVGGDLYATDSAGNQIFLNTKAGAMSLSNTLNGYDNSSGYAVGAYDGFSGATYTLDATPEPPTWALVLSVCTVLAFERLRRRQAPGSSPRTARNPFGSTTSRWASMLSHDKAFMDGANIRFTPG
jgi:hypothetical protein